MKKLGLGLLLVTAAIVEGCGPPALTCQMQTCSNGSGKTYQLCVNIDGSDSWSFGGMSCHASPSDSAAFQSCEQQVAAYCTGAVAGGSPDMAGGGSSCSVVGTFTNTTPTGGMATMTQTGTSSSGTTHLTEVTPNVTITIDATYSVSGNDITMVNTGVSPSTVMGCIGQAAVYAMTWDATCAHMTLHKVSDACPGRIADADGATLTRQ